MPPNYILFGADLVPSKSNVDLFIKGDIGELVGDELHSLLSDADYRVFNLEVPMVDQEAPIIKQGPNLITSTASIEGYKSLGVDLLTLANNHILDQDEQGLKSTIETLDKAGIKHLGTGANLVEASKPFIFNFCGKKIGIYACVEHEFSVASENKAGANPFDPLYSMDHIANLKGITDYVIVLYHGGKEHYRYPSPNLQKICRRLVDKGSDLVICQHSHCIGCEEKYKDGIIVYGQGNFIFDDSDDDCWQTSLLIKLGNDFSISYLPLVKAGKGVRLAGDEKSSKILSAFEKRSEEIKIPGFIEKRYAQYADVYLNFYLQAIAGKRSILSRIINKITKGRFMKLFLKYSYRETNKVIISNYIDCEAHRELFSQALANGYQVK